MILELVHFRYDRLTVLLRSPQLTLCCINSCRSYPLGTYYLALKTNRQSLRILKSQKVYDYLVTVDEEVRGVLKVPFLFVQTSYIQIRLVWPSRFSVAKFLFLANRYLPFCAAILGTYSEHCHCSVPLRI